MKNRKSQFFSSSAVTVFSVIALIILFILFFILFKINTHKYSFSIESAASDMDSDIMLTNILNTPVSVDGKVILMSDYIAIWYYDKSRYKDNITTASQEILNLMEHYYKDIFVDEKKNKPIDCRKVYRLKIDDPDAIFLTNELTVDSANYDGSGAIGLSSSKSYCYPENSVGEIKRDIILPDGKKLSLTLGYEVILE